MAHFIFWRNVFMSLQGYCGELTNLQLVVFWFGIAVLIVVTANVFFPEFVTRLKVAVFYSKEVRESEMFCRRMEITNEIASEQRVIFGKYTIFVDLLGILSVIVIIPAAVYFTLTSIVLISIFALAMISTVIFSRKVIVKEDEIN